MDPTKTAADIIDYSQTVVAGIAAWVPNLLAALAVIAAGYFVAGWAHRGLERVFRRSSRVDPTLAPVVGIAVRYAIFIVVAIAALGQLGVATTSLLATLGAAGLAIGLALQGTLQNIAAGIMILWLRPFRVGEYVDNGTVAGTVREVGLFATLIDTYDGIFRFVPNSDLWSAPISNFTRNATRMTDVAIGIGYDSDVERARKILLELAESNPLVRNFPEPLVFVDNLGDSAVVIRYRVWIGTADFWTVQRALIEEAKKRFDAAGIEIPFPQRVMHVANAAPQAPKAAA